jgi:hypothetical protein
MISRSRFDYQLKLLGLLEDRPCSSSALNLRLSDPESDLPAKIEPEDPSAPTRPLIRSVARAVAGGSGVELSPARDYRGVPVIAAWRWLQDHAFGVATQINAAFPGLASAVELDQLRLTSPTTGLASSLEVLPLRSIDLIEYPPEPLETAPKTLVHGDHLDVDNDGVGGTYGEAWFYAPSGASGPMLVNEASGWQVSLLTTFRPGERAHLRVDSSRLRLAHRRTRRYPSHPAADNPAAGQYYLVPFPPDIDEWLQSVQPGAAHLNLENPSPRRSRCIHLFHPTNRDRSASDWAALAPGDFPLPI